MDSDGINSMQEPTNCCVTAVSCNISLYDLKTTPNFHILYWNHHDPLSGVLRDSDTLQISQDITIKSLYTVWTEYVDLKNSTLLEFTPMLQN